MLESLGQVLPAAAAKYKDKTPLIFEDRVFSFRQLDDLSNAFAAGLVSLGVAPGDRVTLYRRACASSLVGQTVYH